jgi:hypothetical protein
MAAAIILQEYIDTVKKCASVMSVAMLSMILLFFAAFTGCVDTVRYSSAREIPVAPKLLELIPGTKYDTIPAIIVKFSYDDSLPATIRIESAEEDTVFDLSVYDVPTTITSYADPLLTVSNTQTLSHRFYRLFAATPKKIISLSSDTLSLILLDRPPIIDSIVIRGEYPIVYYTIFGQQGVTRRLAITMGDSVILEELLPTPIFSESTSLIKEWSEAPADSLRVWSIRYGRANKPFGVRVIVELPAEGTTAYGIAAASLHVPQP